MIRQRGTVRLLPAWFTRSSLTGLTLRLAPSVPTTSDIVTLAVGDADLLQRLKVALSAVDEVHRFPPSSPAISVRADASLLIEASYAPDEIRIHPERPRRCLALLHELGHFIDDQVLLEDKRATGAVELEQWRRAVLRSDAIASLRETAAAPPAETARQHLLYLLRFTETFARSYVQWICARSGEDRLLTELGDAQLKLFYGEYWSFDDFEEIGVAMDALFRELR
jgi:hypothetical protein